MADRLPTGSDADYFQVILENGDPCGHPHRNIASAVRCYKDAEGASGIEAMWNRRNAIGTHKLYNHDSEFLTDRQIESLLEWYQRFH